MKLLGFFLFRRFFSFRFFYLIFIFVDRLFLVVGKMGMWIDFLFYVEGIVREIRVEFFKV